MKTIVTPPASAPSSMPPSVERELRATHWAVCQIFIKHLPKRSFPDFEEFSRDYRRLGDEKFYAEKGVYVSMSFLRSMHDVYVNDRDNPYGAYGVKICSVQHVTRPSVSTQSVAPPG